MVVSGFQNIQDNSEHSCLFYDNDKEVIDVLLSQIKIAIKNNQKIIYYIKETNYYQQIKDSFNQNSELYEGLKTNQIEFKNQNIITNQKKELASFFQKQIKASKANGYNCLLIIIDLTLFATSEKNDNASIIDFQFELNHIFNQSDLGIISLYDKKIIEPEILIHVLDAHRFIYIEGEKICNPDAISYQTYRSEDKYKKILHQKLDRIANETNVGYNNLKKQYEKAQGILDSILENTTAIIYIKDCKGRFLLVNKEFENVFKIKSTEIIGKTDYDIMPKALADVYKKNDLKIINSQKSIRYEEKAIIDGIEHTALSLKVPVVNSQGIVTGICGISTDITDRIEIENKLKKSEQKYQRLSDATFEAIFISDKGICVSQNKAAQKMFGYTDQEAIGRHGTEWIHPDWRNTVIAKITEKESNPYQVLAQRKDGSTFWTEIQAKTIIIDNQKYRITAMRDISEQRKIEQTRIESEQKFQTFIEHAADAIYVSNMKGEIVNVNIQACKQTGYNKEELLKMTVMELDKNYPKLKDCLVAWNTIEYGSSMKISGAHVRKDGSVFPVEIHSTVIDLNGEKHVLGFVRDITEREKAEILLKESEAKFKSIIENSSNMFYIHDTDNQITYISPQSIELLECTPEEALIKWTDFVTDNPINERGIKITEKTIKTGQPQPPYELELKTATGKMKRVEVRENPIVENGKTVAIVGALIDITDRKKAEIDLIDSEKKYRSLFEYSKNAIVVTNIDGEVIDYNESAREMFKIPIDKMKNKHFTMNFYIDLADREKYMNEIIKNGYITNFETRWRRWDGEIIYTIGSGTLVKTEGKKPFLINTLFDITEIKNSQQQLIKQSKELKEANATKDKFFSIIAHDLKGPLGTITGYSGLVKSRIKHYNTAKLENFIKLIHSSATQTLNLLDNLLEWAKGQQGKLSLNYEQLNLYEILLDIIQEIDTFANKKNISIVVNSPVDCFVYADKNAMMSTYRNLIMNAIKFSYRDSQVKISIVKNKENIKSSITDFGIGIADEKIAYIFHSENKKSSKGTENESGSGLGLQLCQEFVLKHEGKIWVESIPGKATTFYFTIPYKPVNTEIVYEELTLKVSDIQSNTILIVEDDEINYMYLKEVLESFDYNTLRAENGKQAVDMCRNHTEIRFVLMDINMPEMNGYEATVSIKNINPNLPVIMQTAYSMPDNKRKAKDAGCDGFLSKPVKVQDLEKLIDLYMN